MWLNSKTMENLFGIFITILFENVAAIKKKDKLNEFKHNFSSMTRHWECSYKIFIAK